jgi:peroxiredoxin Q/BCP
VVLYFYPKDDTPAARSRRATSPRHQGFEKICAVVLGCSPDSTESHRRFIAKHKLKVGLLSDPDHQMMLEYGAWGEKNMYGGSPRGSSARR